MAHRQGGEKRCSKCKHDKPEDEFYLLKNGKRRSWCKGCVRTDTSKRPRRQIYQPEVQITEKYCPQCNRTLPAAAFSRNRRRPSGLADYCLDCTKKLNTEDYTQRQQIRKQVYPVWGGDKREHYYYAIEHTPSGHVAYRFRKRIRRDTWVDGASNRTSVLSTHPAIKRARYAALLGRYQWSDPYTDNHADEVD